MSSQGRVVWASVAGAAVGGVLGYLYLTESGRRLLDQIEPRLDDFVRETARLRTTVLKARAAARESWRSLNEIVGERPRSDWSAPPRQTSPF